MLLSNILRNPWLWITQAFVIVPRDLGLVRRLLKLEVAQVNFNLLGSRGIHELEQFLSTWEQLLDH